MDAFTDQRVLDPVPDESRDIALDDDRVSVDRFDERLEFFEGPFLGLLTVNDLNGRKKVRGEPPVTTDELIGVFRRPGGNVSDRNPGRVRR